MTFFFTSVFMVMVFWRPQEWLARQLYGWPILDGVFYLALLCLLLEVNMARVRSPRRIPQVYLLGGLWLAAMMSHIANGYFSGLLMTIPSVFKICFFTVLLLCVLDRPSRLQAIAFTFVAMACFMAWHAMKQEKTGFGFANLPPLYIDPIGDRPAHTRSLFFGIFSDPNDLAQLLATSIPFGFALKRKRQAVAVLIGIVVTIVLVRGILTTHSRGGYVALVTVAYGMVVLMLPSRWFPFFAGMMLMGALVLCPFSAGVLDQSAHERIVAWGYANFNFLRHPLFGVGYGMFWQVAEQRAAHNAFVLCYTTIGVFGYWFWFGLLSLGLVGCWRARKALEDVDDSDAQWVRKFAGLTMVSVGAYAASAYFLSRAFVYPMFFLFAVMGAVPAVARDYLPEDHPPFIELRRDIWGLVTVGTFASIAYIYLSILLLNKAFYGG